jgi:adenosylmethionine-8-amino-7-oxononanoate aminotransferase
MPFKEAFGTLVPDRSQVAWDSVAALAAEIDRVGAERVAAFVFEPVIGSGGVLAAPPGYLAEVAALCRASGITTIADVVIGGFGRLGEWLAVERFQLEPDLIVFAKGVTSGYLPLGGVIAAPAIAEPFFAGPGRSFAHGATYAGHATACAAALANLDLLAADDLVHRARALEEPFHRRLVDAVGSHRLVGEVRGGVGLMAAVVLAPHVLAAEPAAATALWHGARRHGVLSRGLFDGIALAPPLTIDDEHLDAICDGVAAALDDLDG